MRKRCRPSPRVLVCAVLMLMLLAESATAQPAATPDATPVASPVASPVATPAATLPDGDASRGGSLPGPAPEGEIGVHWTVRGEGEVGTPVAAGDLVLLRVNDALTAYDASTGDLSWETARDTGISDPFIAAETAYITDGSFLIALDVASGDLLWETNLAFGSTAAPIPDELAPPLQPAVSDGVAYVLSGTLAYAIDASNGDYIWRYDTQGQIAVTPPTVTASSVVFATTTANDDQGALALNRETGQPAAGIARGGSYMAFAALDDLVVASVGGEIVTFYDYSGVITSSHTCLLESDIVLTFGAVHAICGDGLVAIDLLSGMQLPLMPGYQGTVMGVTGETLLVTGGDDTRRTVSAVDLDALTPIWEFSLPPTIEGTLDPRGTVTNGVLAVLTRTAPEAEGGEPGFTLVGIGGTEGPFGKPLPLVANPPAPGTFMRIGTDTDLRAAPSVEGAPIADLAPGDQVLITGQIEEVDGTTWWQVDDPRSGRTGWVTPDVFETGESQ